MLSLAERLQAGLQQGLYVLGGVGRRLLVHAGALLVMGLVDAVVRANALCPWSVDATCAVYVGLICLFPRGRLREPSWYLPTALGMLQGILLVLLGVPWPRVFLWAGLQTWVQRLLDRRGCLGWEWTVAPFLAICLYESFENAILNGVSLRAYASFPVVMLAGGILQIVYSRVRARSLYAARLKHALGQLRAVSDWRVLPETAQQQADVLLAQATAFVSVWASLPRGKEGVDAVDAAATALETAAREEKAQQGKSVLSRGILRSARWSGSSLSPLAQTVETALDTARRANALLLELVRDDIPDKTPETDEERLRAYEISARQLLLKREKLPAAHARHLEAIVAATLNMVRNMRTDTVDMAQGQKFLDRYLRATHRIVDEYDRLATEAPQEDVATALARSGEILERLARAFAEEHAGMLRNDALNYTAELNALDSLLKMRGR